MLGLNENQQQAITRPDKIGYNRGQCADPTKNYEWAEMKSSILIKKLLDDRDVNIKYSNFLKNIMQNIFNVLEINIKNQYTSYMNLLVTSVQKDIIQSYPVAQSKSILTR